MPALPAGSPLAYVHFWPWPPVQGQTVVVWWRTTSAVSVAVEFDGQPVPAQTAGRQGWALLPVGPLDAVRTRTLGLTAGSAPTLTLPFPVTAGVFESGDVPPDTADPILSQAQQVRAEAERMAGLWALDSPFGWTPVDRFRLPLPTDGLHTSPFGTRRIYGSSSIVTTHNGEDYATAAGTPVLAPASGVVVLAEQLFVRGNAVVIDHGHGVLTGYWHMRALSVQAGDRVAPGQPLGEVGTTGLSTGPHLHWEMQVRGVPVDPLEWLAP
jgi:murein DD-endopeptidase MepM/ murein hydrolase activator NlpD